MVDVSYYCPHCGAVTSIDRPPVLQDQSVTPRPDPDREYAATTGDRESADGIEFVCLGDVDGSGDQPELRGDATTSDDPGPSSGPIPGKEGCGRTFYLNFYRSAPEWLADRQ